MASLDASASSTAAASAAAAHEAALAEQRTLNAALAATSDERPIAPHAADGARQALVVGLLDEREKRELLKRGGGAGGRERGHGDLLVSELIAELDEILPWAVIVLAAAPCFFAGRMVSFIGTVYGRAGCAICVSVTYASI